jgi:hypothetical protein
VQLIGLLGCLALIGYAWIEGGGSAAFAALLILGAVCWILMIISDAWRAMSRSNYGQKDEQIYIVDEHPDPTRPNRSEDLPATIELDRQRRKQ